VLADDLDRGYVQKLLHGFDAREAARPAQAPARAGRVQLASNSARCSLAHSATSACARGGSEPAITLPSRSVDAAWPA
jgi:hypothetical protein